ncbi:GIY-YIG nuclease family protein [Flavobacterium sp. TP390]|uniref:GIY-YIG nuclease family protein n=1 Tax=Flavobacterium profundi TaxID=1774945 RepID=A0A6I4ISI1_9FLAO|nr:GIY-YIG nuclease family protein [Flavobacterium profundi]MVO09646.1 GIY-YIG nuclease family protein [Flavobacterium profundi]
MSIVYILYSQKLNRFYIGYTSDFDLRLEFHKNATTRKFTYNATDWILFLKIDCTTKKQALSIEKHIKNMKSKTYIQNLLKYPEIIDKLVEKYSDC